MPLSLTIIIVMLLAQIPFGLGEWIAVPTAPNEDGVYDLIIQAIYDGSTGNFPLQIEVGGVDNSGDLEIDPVYPFSRTPPIKLTYDIHFNGSYDYLMLSNNLTLYYTSGNTLLKSGGGVLALDNGTGHWYTNVNVPLKGDYTAMLTVSVVKNSAIYTGEFLTAFSSDVVSTDLTLGYDIDKKILIPSETFEVSLEAEFFEEPVGNLEIFKSNLYGTVNGLVWNERDGVYSATLTAPTDEGVYLLTLYGEGQDFASSDKIYVAEVAKSKSARCPIAFEGMGGCDDMKDVRKCVSDYKADTIAVIEQEVVACFIDASGDIVQGSITCNGNYKGDFDGDAQHTVNDLLLMQEMIMPLPQSARQDYQKCADYDRDGDVDEEDFTCLTYVLATAWNGDFNGGICFDAVYDSPLKGDLNGDYFIYEDDLGQLRGECVFHRPFQCHFRMHDQCADLGARLNVRELRIRCIPGGGKLGGRTARQDEEAGEE